MTDPVQHQLTVCADVANVRPASLHGKDYIVVPIAMVVGDSVMKGLASEGPEFVPANVLSADPSIWNGRPLMDNHPPESCEYLANTPQNIAALSYGQCFNTIYSDGKLRTEGWIDLDKARQIGGTAQENVERMRRGEMVEVSVCPKVLMSRQSGVSPSGERYEFVWKDILNADHLAILPKGITGACSNKKGCGVPRANATEDDSVSDDSVSDDNKPTDNRAAVLLSNLWRSAKSILAVSQGESDVELRDLLWAALSDTVLGFEDIREVIPDESIVRYSTFSQTNQRVAFWEQEFTIDDGVIQTVEFVDDTGETHRRIDGRLFQVEPTTEWKPVDTVAAASSGDDNDDSGDSDDSTDNDKQEGEVQMPDKPDEKVAALAAELVAHEQSLFTGDDEDYLVTLSEERLTAMVACCAELTADDKDTGPNVDIDTGSSTDTSTTADTVQLSRDEYTEMRAAAAAHTKHVEAQKSLIVASLAGNDRVKGVYTEAQLNDMDLPALRNVSQLVGADDPQPDNFVGLSVPALPSEPAVTAPKPPSMVDAIRANRAAN